MDVTDAKGAGRRYDNQECSTKHWRGKESAKSYSLN